MTIEELNFCLDCGEDVGVTSIHRTLIKNCEKILVYDTSTGFTTPFDTNMLDECFVFVR